MAALPATSSPGAAIGNAEDNRQAKDYCESYLDYYSRPGIGGYPGGAYGYPVAPAAGGYPAGAYPPYGYPAYGYAAPMMMVPVAQPVERRPCTRTVTTEEWITVPVRQRLIPRRAAPDKRVRIVPDKRLRAD